MIALDPNQTFKFHLDVESARPAPARSTFVSRFPTARQLVQIDCLTDEAAACKTEEEIRRLHRQAVDLVKTTMSASPGAPMEFSLDVDAGMESPPRFTAVPMTPEAMAQVAAAVNSAASGGLSAAVETLLQAAGVCLTSNHPSLEDASISELREIANKAMQLNRLSQGTLEALDSGDLFEVCLKIIGESRLTENERKKSALRSTAAAIRRSAMRAVGGDAAAGV